MGFIMKYKFLFFIFIIALPSAQKLDDDLTLEKKALMILPASTGKYEEITDKVLSILSEQASAVGRFEVIDRNLIDQLLEEQKFQLSGMVSDNQIGELGELASAEEALIVDIVHFGQKGVPKEKDDKDDKDDKDETLFSWVVKKTVTVALDNTSSQKEKRQLELENNIRTILKANVRLVNVETGVTKNSFNLNAVYIGGNHDASLERALSFIEYQMRLKLKELYTITSKIIEVNGAYISIFSGENLGLQIGDYFEISSKDRQKTYKGKTINLPGKTRGLARITEVGLDASKAKIIRKWHKVKEGHKAYEMLTNPIIVDLSFSYSEENRYDLTGKYLFNTFNTFSGSLNGSIGLISDSRHDMDFYGGIGPSFNFNLLSGFGTSFYSSLEIPFIIVSRIDDDDNLVTSGSILPSIGLNVGIQIGKHQDLIFSFNNVFLNNKSKWTHTVKTGEQDDNGNDKTKQEPAIWIEEAPTIDATGLFFSISLRHYWF